MKVENISFSRLDSEYSSGLVDYEGFLYYEGDLETTEYIDVEGPDQEHIRAKMSARQREKFLVWYELSEEESRQEELRRGRKAGLLESMSGSENLRRAWDELIAEFEGPQPAIARRIHSYLLDLYRSGSSDKRRGEIAHLEQSGDVWHASVVSKGDTFDCMHCVVKVSEFGFEVVEAYCPVKRNHYFVIADE